MNHLNENGYSAYCLTHQGFGLSYGNGNYVQNFESYLTDYFEFADYIVNRVDSENKLPRFILGHSFGTLIAELLVVRRPDFFKGKSILYLTHDDTSPGHTFSCVIKHVYKL